MYLTQLRLDPRSAQARRDIADPYDMHRTLVRAFVCDSEQKPPRFLWRIEAARAKTDPVVLVQSMHEADWSTLISVRGYLKGSDQEPPVATKQVDFDQLLTPQASYRFRLLANPTVTRNGKRYGLVAEDSQLRWLTRQGKRLGFEVQSALVTASDLLESRSARHICLQQACFEGILKAVDIQILGQTLLTGIGPGKAFGCGLLSVARC